MWEMETAIDRVPTAQGKQGKWQQQNSLSGKTQGIWKFCQNAGKTQGIFVCSSCKFPDSKGNNIAIFAAKFPFFCPEAG